MGRLRQRIADRGRALTSWIRKVQTLEVSESRMYVCGESCCSLQLLEGRVSVGRLPVAIFVKLCFSTVGVCPLECCLPVLQTS